MDLLKKLNEIINDYTGKEYALTPATTFDELGFDSLDVVELLMKVEETFEIEFPDEFQAPDAQGVVDQIQALLNEKN